MALSLGPYGMEKSEWAGVQITRSRVTRNLIVKFKCVYILQFVYYFHDSQEFPVFVSAFVYHVHGHGHSVAFAVQTLESRRDTYSDVKSPSSVTDEGAGTFLKAYYACN